MLIYFAIAVLVIIVAVVALQKDSDADPLDPISWYFTPEYKRAGIKGEEAAYRAMKSVLREDDFLFTNVSIEYESKPTELDFVIVNKYGVYIFEVKNYFGRIEGNENDYMWIKHKTTLAGNTYEKEVKNPIKQVKRQIYLLARYLDNYGERVWVKGYAILLQGNSPVRSEYLLNSVSDFERTIHTTDRRLLDKKTVENIVSILS